MAHVRVLGIDTVECPRMRSTDVDALRLLATCGETE
jgi:hypothetical protein